MTETNVKKMLRIHDRISEVPEVERLIADLDDTYGSSHSFASLMGLEILSSRTACPKNAAVQRSCLVWCMSVVSTDILAQKVPTKMAKEALTNAINAALLKKRLVTFLSSKCKGVDDKEVTYEDGKAPSTVLNTLFGTMASFRAAGLHDISVHSGLAWLSKLPGWQAEVVDFCAKLMRGHKLLDELVLKAVSCLVDILKTVLFGLGKLPPFLQHTRSRLFSGP